MVTRISAPSATATEGAASPLRKARAQAPAVARRAAQALPPAARKAAGAVQKNVRRAATGMLGLSGERMSKVDTAWLRMDSASNLMMINGVWTLSPGIGWEALCERVQQRLLQYPRFRQRVVEDAAGATWVEDRQFDIAAHVLREKLTAPKGEKACSARCRTAWASWPCSRWTRAARCGRCTSSKTSWATTANQAARSSCASTTASPTASR